MKALIFGHSQSGGMGLKLQSVLQGAGISVTRVTRNGADDADLIAYLSSLPKGPFDRVFLYAGGNSTSPTVAKITKLVKHFGADKVTVILPPVNRDRKDQQALTTLRAKNEGNRKGLAKLVPVFVIEAGADSFQKDEIHLWSSSPEARELAQNLVAEGDDPGLSATTKVGTPFILVALAAIGVFLMFKERKRGLPPARSTRYA